MNRPASALPIWHRLGDIARHVLAQTLLETSADAGRFERMCHRAAGLTLDLSKQRLSREALAALLELADVVQLKAGLAALMGGSKVNTTESRPALHPALRANPDASALVTDTVIPERERMLALAERIRTGHWRGLSGKAITDVVHIGIGGSHLGPALAVDALPGEWNAPRCHFIANVDGNVASTVLNRLNPETTLFIIASKSFGTIESKVNAENARAWFIERTGSASGFAQHAIAITSNPSAAAAMGIEAAHTLSMWDWVGGRYSIWSSVGLPIAIRIGARGFREFLDGAAELDRHALDAPAARNLPVLLALTGIWNFNFLGAQSHAVLPYSHRLRMFPDYLQQLEMESNGKSVRHDGSRVDVQTMPVLWGGEGTNGQHAFHQFLHQGTRAFSVDFIATIAPDHNLDAHHDWLLANCLAQSEALLQGRSTVSSDPLANHRAMPGNRGSTTILLDALTPKHLGALIALYEHKVYCQGMIWDINSFDQWGVELGKTIGETLFAALGGKPITGVSPATLALIDTIKRRR
ncbi:MAG: glucose-6-phosphate isomerase [Gammaproteobacteria bacterium]|nr:glucose-6-phosphate isomerase [Gammaproteobacteria bacterium]